MKSSRFLGFEDARAFVRTLNLKSYKQWRSYVKGQCPEKGNFPKNIPKMPDSFYKDEGWIGYADFLGFESSRTFKPSPRQIYLDFNEALVFVRRLSLKSFKEWTAYSRGDLKIKRPANIPSAPNINYRKNGWTNWGDWLGTGRILHQKTTYLSLNEAKEIVHKHNFKSSVEYKEWHDKKSRKNIPKSADLYYKNLGWKNWGDFLGPTLPSSSNDRFASFQEARAFIRKLKIKNQREWLAFCAGKLKEKKPKNIPSLPESIYKEFVSYGDWLGNGNVASVNKDFLSFIAARTFIRKLKLKTTKDWNRYSKTKRPKNIPSCPLDFYKEWKGIKDWLGTN